MDKETQALKQQEQEYNEIYQEDKTAWYELVTSRHFNKNVEYIKSRIRHYEKEIEKFSDSDDFGATVSIKALLKVKKEFQKLLRHYEHVREEKIQADYRLSEKAGKSENIPVNKQGKGE